MPRIPIQEYQRQNVPTDLGPMPRATGPDMPNYEGSALSNLGAALSNLGETAGAYAAKFKTEEDQTRAKDAYANTFGPQFRELYNNYYQLQGKDALDRRPDVEKQMLELRTTVRDGLKNDQQKKIFDGVSVGRMEQELDGMARHAAAQRRVWMDQTHMATLENYVTTAADKSNDPQAFNTAIQGGLAEIDKYAADNGQSSEVTRFKSQGFVSKAWSQRIERAALYDPLAAQQMYGENAQLIAPAERVQLERKLKSAVQPVLVKRAADEIMAPDQMQQLERNGYVNVSLQDGTAPAPGQGPTTTRDTKAQLAVWLQQADQRAAKDFPDDPVAKDMLVAAIKGRVSTILQMQEGVQRQAQGNLINYIIEKKPGSIDQVLANPDMRANWNAIDPQSKVGIIALAKRDAEGDKIKTNPAVFRDVYSRIHADDGDPNKITSDTQLVPFMGKGLSYDDLNHLRNEMKFANSPEGSVFQKDVQTARTAAHRMLRGSILGGIQPDVAEDAAYRFTKDLDAKIEQARKDGKDPRDLLIPGKPEYVLDPKRVATFMPGAVDAMRTEAGRVKATGPNAGAGTIQQAPTVNDEAAYNALKKGDKYVDGRDGQLKEKR